MAARIKSMLAFPAQRLPRGSYKGLMIQSLGRLNGGGREEPRLKPSPPDRGRRDRHEDGAIAP